MIETSVLGSLQRGILVVDMLLFIRVVVTRYALVVLPLGGFAITLYFPLEVSENVVKSSGDVMAIVVRCVISDYELP